MKQSINYHEEIIIDPKPIKFPSFVLDSRAVLLKRYNVMDRMWMLPSNFWIGSNISYITTIKKHRNTLEMDTPYTFNKKACYAYLGQQHTPGSFK
jgi:hypothetical protein